tara:strand:+ start:31976 stop:38377 length:6402 start_codon:yes stop_codon:yes gene_type:complete
MTQSTLYLLDLKSPAIDQYQEWYIPHITTGKAEESLTEYPTIRGMPQQKVDLVPPMGTRAGLPYTFIWADTVTQKNPTTVSGSPLGDAALWTEKAGGVNQQPAMPTTVGKATPSSPVAGVDKRLDPVLLNYYGLTSNTESPVMNFADSSLEYAQSLQSSGDSRLATKRSYMAATVVTKTENGRFNSKGDCEMISGNDQEGRPANHTWHQWRHDEVDDNMRPDLTPSKLPLLPVYDIHAGSQVDTLVTPNPSVESILHKSQVCLPSNGLGATYGDNHNMRLASSLVSSPVHDFGNGGVPALAGVKAALEDSFEISSLWAVNLMSVQRCPTWSDKSNGDVDAKLISQPDGHGQGAQPRVYPKETIQVFGTKDVVSGPSVANQSDGDWRPLGRVDTGNIAVMDSIGLIGYEGIITASAFMSVSEDANPPDISAGGTTSWNGTNMATFAGINIQVHSGLGVRRNGVAYQTGDTTKMAYKYGTDGAFVAPIQDAMITTGVRDQFKGSLRTGGSSVCDNQTRFFTGRTQNAETTGHAAPLPFDVTGEEYIQSGMSGTDPKHISHAVNKYIVGDTTNFGTSWSGTSNVSQDFCKNKIPTKVQVVPTLIGYETVSVAAGYPVHPSNLPLTFKRPIVDYHVLVSLAPRDRLAVSANLANDKYGMPINRNNPQTARLTANMDLEDEGCEIYHAVFRLNPTLERIFFDTGPTNTGGGHEATCPTSVIPRTWGLHQLTPFRPIANSGWSQIPTLSGAIEAGGFYQRGGISHHWSAAGYSDELFVGVDVIEMAHLDATVYGNGQYKTDGDANAATPDGCELVIFKYAPRTDPFYTNKETTAAHLQSKITSGVTATTVIQSGVTFATDTGRAAWRGWDFHDWVFPQVELMRYLGREDKGNMRHPRHSLNTSASPMFHPTLHCGDLSITENGELMIAAVHRDYIGSEEEYPSATQGYPFNPDIVNGGGCPAGYYYKDGACIPITDDSTPPSTPAGTHYDPFVGGTVDGDPPSPSTGSGTGYAGGSDNFGPFPSWSRLVANTSARSLILLFCPIDKNEQGKLKSPKTKFEYQISKSGGETIHTQNWVTDTGWWSGSRIAYWYQESGQRAIPITYGSYPEMRMSHAHLPKCLPHLLAGDVIMSGYPESEVLTRTTGWNAMNSVEYTLSDTSQWPPNSVGGSVPSALGDSLTFVQRTHFIPTTIGFCDFGMGANPYQEYGWSGWGFPRGLYDPIGSGDNTLFFSDDPEAVLVAAGTLITPTAQGLWNGYAASPTFGTYMAGCLSAISHHGPLHYGVMSKDHPFRPDRIWKQVHGGLGYDIPLFKLIPPRVSVRAKSGGRNSLDLEMETPFHRQNADYLTGARGLNPSSNAGGQYFLRSNLWNTDLPTTIPAGVKQTGYFAEDRLRGPILQGTTGHDLQLFWQDHPTEHFHAGAIPVNTGSDYDITNVETERYAPSIIGRAMEMSKHDYIAMAEQLMSSVDVHVSKSVRAFWDSGSIVSARGSGLRDSSNAAYTPTERAEMKQMTLPVSEAVSSAGHVGDGLGKGQRILRTEDGTLHVFTLDRGTTTGSSNIPQWTHHAKQLNNDLFWNRKAMKVNPSTSAYDGKDECKPRLVDLGGATPTGWATMGASFASDSLGTIHAVIQIKTAADSSRLYYTYAKRKLASYQPFPVYEWDWSAHTPLRIEAASITGDGWDLREPTLVCDSLDRLHLACRVLSGASTSATKIRHSHIIYATKLATEVNFPYLESGGTGDYADTLTGDLDWTIVNHYTNNPVAASDNQLSSSSGHASQDNDKPKICLLGDDIPVVFYRGMSTNYGTGMNCETAYGARAYTAIYVNVAAGASTTTPAGRFVFTSTKATMALGQLSGSHSGGASRTFNGVKYYDAVIDSDNKAYVIGVTDDAKSEVSLNSFVASDSLSAQYSTTDGLGKTQILFKQRDADVTYTYSHLTATISDKDQLHMILNFTLQDNAGIGLGAVGETDTQEGTLAPLIWAGTPADPATLSYELPATVTSWPTGGSNQSLTGSVKHFLEVWMPTHEVSQAAGSDEVIRSVNVRWLSVPSMGYDSTDGFYPVGSSQTLSGYEDFIHHAPQLRYQRYWGYNAGELDLRWLTNELSWIATPHGGSKLYYPYIGGSSVTVGEGETSGEGIAGWP